jgi:hypothetical protein
VRWSGLFVLWAMSLVLHSTYEWCLIYGRRETQPSSF